VSARYACSLAAVAALAIAGCASPRPPASSSEPLPARDAGDPRQASGARSLDARAAVEPSVLDAGAPLPLPPIGAAFDYQLGGAYPPAAGVQIVVRDRTAAPEPGLYSICYVNGFQVQPDETAAWLAHHRELVLTDADGKPVIDRDWNELLLDVRTPAKRAALATIVAGWIHGCKQAGFDAVEIDNLDAYTRSGGRLTAADAIAAMRLFADAAHADGLAIAQKNAVELAPRRADLATDFAIAEECARYRECAAYAAAYADHVLVIEYRRPDFTAACASWRHRLSLVLRDRDLAPRGQHSYVFDRC
jgi:hypothetical protein